MSSEHSNPFIRKIFQELQTNHQQTQVELAAIGAEKDQIQTDNAHLHEQTTVDTEQKIHRCADEDSSFLEIKT